MNTIRVAIAGAISAAVLCGGAGVVAHADSGQPVATGNTFSTTVTPRQDVRVNQKLIVKSVTAVPSTDYNCAFVIARNGRYAVDVASNKFVRSGARGHVTCRQKFTPYTATFNGKTRHCPLRKADAKAGFKCGVGIFTTDRTSQSVARFAARASKSAG